MIRYSLECNKGHAFDGWFRNSDAFDRQVKRHLVTCPDCGSQKIEKSIMAPNVSTKKSADRGEVAPVAAHARPDGAVTAARQQVIEAMRQLRKTVAENSEYVGPRFAEEARKIHYKETEEKGIYGEATVEDVKQLIDEGIECHPLPVLPEDQN